MRYWPPSSWAGLTVVSLQLNTFHFSTDSFVKRTSVKRPLLGSTHSPLSVFFLCRKHGVSGKSVSDCLRSCQKSQWCMLQLLLLLLLLLPLFFYLTCVKCVCVCSAQEQQKRACSPSLELDTQSVIYHQAWGLRTEFWTSRRVASTHNCWTISLVLRCFLDFQKYLEKSNNGGRAIISAPRR